MKCDAFCEDSTSFPGICYLIDFIDTPSTVNNFVRKTKLISAFFKKRLNISKITKSLFRSETVFLVFFRNGNPLGTLLAQNSPELVVFRLQITLEGWKFQDLISGMHQGVHTTTLLKKNQGMFKQYILKFNQY